MMVAGHLPAWFRSQTGGTGVIIRTKGRAGSPEYAAVKLAIGFPREYCKV